MLKFLSYTFLTVLTVDFISTSGDVTMTWTSPIIPKLKSNDSEENPFDKPITANEESWIGSLINIGAIIGSLPYGFIAKKFGRKIGLLCVAVPHIVSYLTLAFSKSVNLYYFARLLGGIAVGGGYTLQSTYVAEIAEDSNRGTLSTSLGIFAAFGNLLSYLIGPYTSILCFNIILACIPTAFLILFSLVAPETPHFLVSKNRIAEAEKSLIKLRRQDRKGVQAELQRIQLCTDEDEKEENFLDLFRSRIYLKALGISLTLVIASQLSGINAVLFYTQDIFEAAGVTGIEPEVSSIIIGVVLLCSSIISPLFSDKFGRRLLLMVSCFGTAIALAAFGVYFYLQSRDVDVDKISWLPIVSLVTYIIMFNTGIGPLPWTIASEIFPTSVKSYTASLVSISCYVVSFIVTKFFNDLNDVLGKGGTFWLFGGFCAASGIFTLLFVPETKGKSFGEIQEILQR